ncbi:MAG: hypothetical protein CMG00_04620 [Candidatus Marinimicrobia bacterium]|nr:hypothetical protein [Candidatus Neomarinimicrobiota bacterium]|tara:strand:- start:12244 stop:13986 length:1743 start_codon:yes stop_codon:yes gene_type:complete
MYSNKRTISIAIVFMLFFLVFVKFFYLQVIQYETFKDRAINKVVRVLPIEAPRGNILDRSSLNIVVNSKVYDLQVVPYDVNNHFNYKLLNYYVPFDTSEIKEKIKFLNKNTISRKFKPLSIKNKIDQDVIFKIEEQRNHFPGLVVREVFIRDYFYDSNMHMAHILGATKIERYSSENPIFDKIYLNPSRGSGGLERFYNNLLSGINGKEYRLFDAMGMDRGLYMDGIYSQKKPISGANLNLTIDIHLQTYIYDLIKDVVGTVICSNPKNGELLAYVNSPTIDIKKILKGISQSELDSLNSLNGPFLNRAINVYEPGSVIKLPVAIMLLELGVDPYKTYNCDGAYEFKSENQRPKKCWKEGGHGDVNLIDAIVESCNIYFYHSVIDNYNRFYRKKWYSWMDTLGFGKLTGIDLLYEKKAVLSHDMSKSKMLNMVIGQEMRVTPLQVIQMINIIANDGFMFSPHINKDYNSDVRKISLNKKKLNLIKSSMKDAVYLDWGTAKRARLKNSDVMVMGKTGTAQQSGGKSPHAWYAGYMEYKEKKDMVSIVVMLENGGKGGELATDIARKIFNKIIELNTLNGYY